MRRMIPTIVLLALLLSGPAFAQAAAPADPKAPATAAPMGKQGKSKECSAEADKQGLHGKARKAFRSKCKAGKT